MTIYDIIADLRREYPTPSASRALDMVVTELGATHDNVRQALKNIEAKPVPSGGLPVLEELLRKAEMEGLADLDYGERPVIPGDEPPEEELDEATIGIGLLLGGTALVLVALAGVAVAIGVIKAISNG